MQWNERWRWLHRIKGIVASVRASFLGDVTSSEGKAAVDAHDRVKAIIDRLKPCKTTPDDMDEQWRELKDPLAVLMCKLSGAGS